MTKEEAMTRWCPFVRASNSLMPDESGLPQMPAYNRLVASVEDTRSGAIAATYDECLCIADHCMAWTGSGCAMMGRVP